MITITIENGDPYYINKTLRRDDYIRIEWSTGYVYMRMYNFNKLKKKQKELLLTDK